MEPDVTSAASVTCSFGSFSLPPGEVTNGSLLAGAPGRELLRPVEHDKPPLVAREDDKWPVVAMPGDKSVAAACCARSQEPATGEPSPGVVPTVQRLARTEAEADGESPMMTEPVCKSALVAGEKRLSLATQVVFELSSRARMAEHE